MKRVPRAYLDWGSGTGTADSGESLRFLPSAPPSALLQALPQSWEQSHVFFCGELPKDDSNLRSYARATLGGPFEWCLEDKKLWEEWEDLGITKNPRQPRIPLRNRKTGRRVTLYSAKSWFGEELVSPDLAREVLEKVEELIRGWVPEAHVFPTPGRTGRELWGLRHSVNTYPPLSQSLRDLIHRTSGQGRSEFLSARPLGEGKLPSFFYYDRIFAYAAFVDRLPVGLLYHDDRPQFERYLPGRYRIRFRVPEWWETIGIFPVMAEEEGEKTWIYPGAAEHAQDPGEVYETWVDQSLLLLGGNQGWEYEIVERIVFELPHKGEPEPLTAWRDRLVALRERAGQHHRRAFSEREAEVWRLVVWAIRNIVLHAIGSFHRTHSEKWHVLPAKEGHKIPDQWAWTAEYRGENVYYMEAVLLSKIEEKFSRPEWSAQIWQKCQASMLYCKRFGQGKTGALGLSRESLVGIYTDAIYTTHDLRLPESGEVGALRLKGAIRQPVMAPENRDELSALRDRAEEELLIEKGREEAPRRA
jgi:hypothetical protein